MGWDEAAIRSQFPILRRRIRTLDGRERPIVYMDHAASTHAPTPVIRTVTEFLEGTYANIHRASHTLSVESSERFDAAMASLLRFVGGDAQRDVAVLGHNTTSSLDLAAHVMAHVPGRTVVSLAEHHSNDLPHRRRGPVAHVGVDAAGRLRMDALQSELDKGGVKLVAITGASNVTGSAPDIHRIARMAHAAGARILVDAAQLYAHRPTAMKPHGHPEHLDFVAAAGHKAYAPLGGSVLVSPRDVLDAAPPYMPGGGTVEWVTESSVQFTTSPDRHMGGTPNIVGALAFAAASDWLAGFGMDAVRRHEEELLAYALRRFAELEPAGVRLLGPKSASEKVGVLTFTVAGQAHEAVAAALNHEHAVAARDGCFCAHPLLHRLLGLDDGEVARLTAAMSAGQRAKLPGATRASLGIYNTKADVDALCDGLDAIARGRLAKYEVGADHVCRPVPAMAV